MRLLSSGFLVIDDDNNHIIYRDYIDISVAVATPKVGDALAVY
jgi:pyruvate/2-oxoglutarate dehydrogenase complex dihydrolipoamide acyltransferase (E2) component